MKSRIINELSEISEMRSTLETMVYTFVSKNIRGIVERIISSGLADVIYEDKEHHINLGVDFTGIDCDGNAVTVSELIYDDDHDVYCLCDEIDDLLYFEDLGTELQMDIINYITDKYEECMKD